jgi:hypothetical protein
VRWSGQSLLARLKGVLLELQSLLARLKDLLLELQSLLARLKNRFLSALVANRWLNDR